ncbi:MAG: hypothetical protein Q7S74_00585 [Nanoarchaeota archaeon]|nr:hypothetical protein [Nanoarchaeota archaeon]
MVVLVNSYLLILALGFALFSKNNCDPSSSLYKFGLSSCNNHCTIDNDCKFTCGCGAINNNENCNDKGIVYDCVDMDVTCKSNKCVLGSELSSLSGKCEIEPKTQSWLILDGVVIGDVQNETLKACLNNTIIVTGYKYDFGCPINQQCYNGSYLKIKSVEFID